MKNSILNAKKDQRSNGHKTIDKKLVNTSNLPFSFPTEIFPRSIQDLITNAKDTVGFNPDYLSAGIFSTCATAIGNSAELFNGSYNSSPITWLAIVGRSGIGKTHPLKFAKDPIEIKDKQGYEKFKSLKQKFDAQEDEKGEKPKYIKSILGDFTPEKLTECLQQNPKGALIFRDELLGWIKSFDKYKKGGDQQMYLEFFNGDPLSVDRVSKAPIRIEKTNVNILGGMQPSALEAMASNNRDSDGFLARFLFVYPSNLKSKKFTGKSIDTPHKENYSDLINDLYGMGASTLKASNSQIEIYKQWQHKKVEECHNDDLETLIQSKLETYVWRFSLIIELIEQATKGTFNNNLCDESINKAINLAEYFRKNALKVYDKISSTNPLDKLSENKQELFRELPMEFKKGDHDDLFKKYSVSGGTLSRFLNKKELFKRVDSIGNYKKMFN